MRKYIITVFLIVVGIPVTATPSNAQQYDSTMVFGNPQNPLITADTSSSLNSYGLDVLFSNNGFGLGFFYRKEYSRTLQGFASLAISEAKDNNEVEYYDPYTYQSIVPGKINRFLVFPLTFGVQYRLFEDEILDNFRPYISGGVGPAVVLSSPYEKEFFNSLGYARAHWTFNAFVGAGAFFGNEKGNIMGVSFRYYILPVIGGILSMADPVSGAETRKTDFGGFFISINFASSF
jgi:drug/metabolite transporter (DMT)-like permease